MMTLGNQYGKQAVNTRDNFLEEKGYFARDNF